MFEKKWVKEYLTFNKKDRIAFLGVVAIIAGCVFLPGLLSGNASSTLVLNQDSVLLLAIDTLEKRQDANDQFRKEGRSYAYQYESSQTKSFTNGALFKFDPNTISAADWQRMGLNEKTSKTIEKYVSKGGKFYKPEDLQKIWGMPEGFYERVKDYVVIVMVNKTYPSNTFESKPFLKEARRLSVVNINEADTSAFIALPGIGSKLSARIIGFREKLGGFYSVEQVGETYGLPDSTFQKLKGRLHIDGINLKKISINTATKDDLKVHPYIKWNLANAIVEYRNQHGAFKSLEELKNIALVDKATFEKIEHYLTL